MVVDDDPQYAELVACWLQRAGYEVEQFCGGLDAIAKARASKADLLVTDIVMPGGLDGWDLAYLLELSGAALPVILMTGLSHMVREQNRQLPRNVIGYLEKPFRESDLRALIPAALKPAAGRAPG